MGVIFHTMPHVVGIIGLLIPRFLNFAELGKDGKAGMIDPLHIRSISTIQNQPNALQSLLVILRRLRPCHQYCHHAEQTPDVVHKAVTPVGDVLVVRDGERHVKLVFRLTGAATLS